MERNASWIDISVPLRTNMTGYPGDPPVTVSRFPGNGEEPVVSCLSLGAHAGTHVDSPLHYIPSGKGIDEMPSEAMIGRTRVITIDDPAVICARELQEHNIVQGERILFKTRNSNLWKYGIFSEDYVHLSMDAASLLAEKGVMIVGIDYLSIAGFNKNESEIHRTLLAAGIWIIEGLDLSAVGAGQHDLLCLPLLISGSEAAPARVMVRPVAS